MLRVNITHVPSAATLRVIWKMSVCNSGSTLWASSVHPNGACNHTSNTVEYKHPELPGTALIFCRQIHHLKSIKQLSTQSKSKKHDAIFICLPEQVARKSQPRCVWKNSCLSVLRSEDSKMFSWVDTAARSFKSKEAVYSNAQPIRRNISFLSEHWANPPPKSLHNCANDSTGYSKLDGDSLPWFPLFGYGTTSGPAVPAGPRSQRLRAASCWRGSHGRPVPQPAPSAVAQPRSHPLLSRLWRVSREPGITVDPIKTRAGCLDN